MEPPGPRYEQLAAQIRRDIYSGVYPQDSVLPSESALASRHQMSRALVNRALQLLAYQELVSQEQGRGTYVARRRLYRVTVEVPGPAGARAARGALLTSVTAATAAEAAVTGVESAWLEGGLARVTLLVEAAEPDHAAHVAKLAVRLAAADWPGGGWDLTLAWYSAGPA